MNLKSLYQQSNFWPITKLLILGSILLGLVIYNFTLASWSNPTGFPPTNNVPAPINVGTLPTSIQSGQGSLQFDFLGARNTVQSNVEMRSPRYCDENGENCFDATMITYIYNYISVLGDKWLVNNQHTEDGCKALSGTVINDGNGNKFCRYTATSCPPNWTQYNNYISYNSKTCSGYSCVAPSIPSCTVNGVAWGSRAGIAPSCRFNYYTHTSGGCDALQYFTCYAPVASIGCY